MSVIPALRGWRQEDHEFKMSLCYTVKACPKKKEKEEEDEVLGKPIHGRGPELRWANVPHAAEREILGRPFSTCGSQPTWGDGGSK